LAAELASISAERRNPRAGPPRRVESYRRRHAEGDVPGRTPPRRPPGTRRQSTAGASTPPRAAAAGDRGCISIFGRAAKDGRAHELLAEHVARSEKWVEVKGPAGLVREWTPLPIRPDNYWFDCLVGCAAAASMCGVKAAGEVAPVRTQKRYTQEDLRRR